MNYTKPSCLSAHPDTVFQFTANYPVDFPILFDRDSAAVNVWPVKGLSSTFVVDPQGRIAYRAIGGREWGGGTTNPSGASLW